MTNAIVQHSIDDMWRMAQFIAKSGLFGVKGPEQAMALMITAQAEGKHPAIAAKEYDIIQGKAALKADALLARFQKAGGSVEWVEYTDEKVAGKFTHPQGGTVLVDWDTKRAQQAGLTNKDNWKKFPRAMRRARCISEGVHTVYPACCIGEYVTEEVQDFDDQPRGKQHVREAEVVNDAPAVQDFSEPVRAGSAEFKAMGDGFNRPRTVDAPAEPEAAALDQQINGPGFDPNHEVPTAFKPERKMVALKDLDYEHAERALKLAEWQVAKTKEFSANHNEGTKNIPILQKLLASMPKPTPEPTETAPVASETQEVASEPAPTEQEPSGTSEEPEPVEATVSIGTMLAIALDEAGLKQRAQAAKVMGILAQDVIAIVNDDAALTAEMLDKLEAANVDVRKIRAALGL